VLSEAVEDAGAVGGEAASAGGVVVYGGSCYAGGEVEDGADGCEEGVGLLRV
jgi:hypothetical protein